MKKIAGMMLACLAGWGGVCAQSVYPGQFEGKFKIENSVPMAAERCAFVAQPFQGEYGARFGLDGLDRG